MSLLMSLVGKALGRVFADPSRSPVSQPRMDNRQAWAQLPGSTRVLARAVRVVQVVEETADTRSLWLACQDVSPLDFQAGQFLTCCFQIDGQEVRRAYSLSNVPGSEYLRITVKRLEAGRVSAFVHQLQVGDRFHIRGPSGDFVLPETLSSAVFIAGGSGITPIRSQIEVLLQRHPGLPVQLIYASRGEQNIIFRNELDALAQAHPQLTLHYLTSRPKTKPLRQLIGNKAATEGRHYFICGPEGFMALAQTTLQALAVAPAQMRSERFLAAATASQPRPTQAQSIHFVRSGKTVQAQPGQSVLEAGLEAGIALEYSCQVGGCGHCRIKVNQGEVVSDEPNCLSDAERDQGYRLACLSYACTSVTVEA